MTIEDIARKPLSKQRLDDVLARATQGADRVPGVVAMITDREGNIYEGAAGERTLGSGVPMTLDTTFALFSTTKAITGTAVLQCVEEGLLDLDAPAATYVPDIGELKVLDGFDAGGTPFFGNPSVTSPLACCSFTLQGSATTSSTSRTTGSRRNMGSPA